ncbi:MAG: YraN family protein [Candidatus Promineifilaceae bacterium]|nr:YraN family protein [Candidatus Promineifilaceae bacterium]
MSRQRHGLGRWGESLAVRLLQKKGYRIVQRNWRSARGEIDLIVEKDDEWVFVEVKTRRGRAMGTPEEALTESKARQLMSLALEYVASEGLDVDWRIDLVAVELDRRGRIVRCEHIPNAVLGW